MGDSYEWTRSSMRRRLARSLAISEAQQAEGHEMVKRTYIIEAAPNVIKTFERFIRHLQYCAGVGHSATVAMGIDGDGADRFKVLSPDLPKADENDVAENAKGSYELVRGSD